MLNLPAAPTPPKPQQQHSLWPAVLASPRAGLAAAVAPRRAQDSSLVRSFAADSAAVAQSMQARGVRLLALDFDQTLVSVHTRGIWDAGAADLCGHVRPLFRALLPEVLRQGIVVAVVTFSPQTDLIRDCLARTVGDGAELIIVRGDDGSWQRTAAAAGPDGELGKQAHIASACDEVQRLSGRRPSGPEVVLVDDDEDNIGAARANGHGVWHLHDGSVAELRGQLGGVAALRPEMT